MQIAMKQTEINLFESFLIRARSYLEFGAGGSTILASSLVRGPLFSVDSSRDWLERVRAEIPESIYTRKLVLVDIGPVGDWGAPQGSEHRHKFPNYFRDVWDESSRKCDLYLVDGRFRVACFAQALLEMPDGAIIGMHDYSSRSYYHVVENLARPVATSDDLTFFVKLPNVSKNALDNIIAEFSLDPS